MPIETAALNEKVIQAAKRKDKKVLKELLETSRLTKFVVNELILDNAKEACLFLVRHQFARLQDFACAAAQANNQAFADYILYKMHKASEAPNYNRMAAFAAKGGYQALAEYFLDKIKDEGKRNYNLVAAFAAKGGHQVSTEYFLNKIKDESKRNYKLVAKLATECGHHALANKYNALVKTRKSGPTISHTVPSEPAPAAMTPPKIPAPKVAAADLIVSEKPDTATIGTTPPLLFSTRFKKSAVSTVKRPDDLDNVKKKHKLNCSI